MTSAVSKSAYAFLLIRLSGRCEPCIQASTCPLRPRIRTCRRGWWCKTSRARRTGCSLFGGYGLLLPGIAPEWPTRWEQRPSSSDIARARASVVNPEPYRHEEAHSGTVLIARRGYPDGPLHWSTIAFPIS